MKLTKLILLTTFCLSATGVYSYAQSEEQARLLRFPTTNGQELVFTYAGDLYTVSIDGGTARKLTSHNGFEMFAKFSPDGGSIAFTGQYDGNTEVFIMPMEGGSPRRITHTATLGRDDVGDRMGPNNIVMGWTPDGKQVIFRSRMQSFNDFKGHLFTVNATGGIPRQLPFSVAGFCSYSPDGSKIAFNRVFREFRTWKYYQGGMADNLRIFDFNTKETTTITDHPGQDIIPMWYGDKIYFLSDRDRTMNLFVYDVKSAQTRKVTHFKDYDIKFPSLGNGFIVFEKGGYLFKMNLIDEKVDQIPVFIHNDFNDSRSDLISVSGRLSSVSPSPKAERLVLSARGDIFNVPTEAGITRNLTQSSGVHERNAEWSPDGQSIAFLSDESGEFEIYLIDQANPGKKTQITTKSDTYLFSFKWSPDSRMIAYHDKKFRLWIIDLESKKKTLVDESGQNPIGDYHWSPDSKWISYVNPGQGMNQISLYSLESKKSTQVTDNWYNSGSPVFSEDGKYLFFVSARDFNPDYSRTEWNHIYQDMNSIYLITLAADEKNPLGYKDATIETVKKEAKDKENNTDTSKGEVKTNRIDLDNIQNRIIRLPIAAGEYFGLETAGDKVFYLYTSSTAGGTELKSFSLGSGKETSHGKNLNFTLTPDGKKMVLMQGRNLSVVPTPAGQVSMGESVNLGDMKALVNKQEEWSQIFDESWRHMRDFFYDPGMHGVDWNAVYKKYKPLVQHVHHRSDLSYLIGEMIGELNVGHAYVNNGERPMPERIQTGMLGAVFTKTTDGSFRIDRILTGATWSASLRSPLREVGMSIQTGDLITAVDGIPVRPYASIYELLHGKAEKLVELTLARQGNLKRPYTTLVRLV